MKKKRLLIYFCICLALLTLLGVSFFYLRKLNALEKNNERVDHSYQVIIQTDLLEEKLLNAETSQRGYLLTENSDFLESYLSELKAIPDIFSTLGRLTLDNLQQQRNLDTLGEIINKQLNVLKENMTGDLKDSIPIERFRQSSSYMYHIRDVIALIKKNESDLLSERSEDKTKNTSESKRSSFLSLFVAFALCVAASVSIIWFFNRNEIYRRDLEDKLSELTTLNLEVKELAIASAHNLQEPMRKVQMIIDWLQHVQGVREPQVNEQLQRIKEIYNKQQVMNNRIIDYYDILMDNSAKKELDPNALIQELLQKNNWTTQFSLKLGRLTPLLADPNQMEQLFTHLIRNAIQFKDPSRPLELNIYEERIQKSLIPLSGLHHERYVCIVVSDNGIGIGKEYHHKIFDLFQKLEVSADAQRSGMGLSFCKRILLNHGGRISARNNAQYGISILLFFPQTQGL